MNWTISLLIFCSSMWIVNENPIKKYQWKKRVIIVSSSVKSAIHKEQLNVLTSNRVELHERDLIIVELKKNEGIIERTQLNSTAVQTIRQHYTIPDNKFTIVLIGKDGTVKLSKDEFTSPTTIFRLIDSMPMRKSEMRRKGN